MYIKGLDSDFWEVGRRDCTGLVMLRVSSAKLANVLMEKSTCQHALYRVSHSLRSLKRSRNRAEVYENVEG